MNIFKVAISVVVLFLVACSSITPKIASKTVGDGVYVDFRVEDYSLPETNFLLDIKNDTNSVVKVDWDKSFYTFNKGTDKEVNESFYVAKREDHKLYQSKLDEVEVINPKSVLNKEIFLKSVVMLESDNRYRVQHRNLNDGEHTANISLLIDGKEKMITLSTKTKMIFP
ncbi:MAG: hypothetical protein HWE24_18075 [Oceanospirillaceae bacterium]|nr:hypothetical protein [Oceanospirillaceae bacterium]